jgi:hypothetical protein
MAECQPRYYDLGASVYIQYKSRLRAYLVVRALIWCCLVDYMYFTQFQVGVDL